MKTGRNVAEWTKVLATTVAIDHAGSGELTRMRVLEAGVVFLPANDDDVRTEVVGVYEL